jgi:hypothetical protein
MDAKVESLYRNIFTDLVVDQDESQDLVDFFSGLNPPPDKLVWLRSTAFRLGCEFLSHDKDNNVALLRAINAIVHSLEQTCMVPKLSEGNSEFDSDKVGAFYAGLFADLKVDMEENEELVAFFDENTPPSDNLVSLRATAFKSAVDFLSEDHATNISLLRCINVVLDAFEKTCLL